MTIFFAANITDEFPNAAARCPLVGDGANGGTFDPAYAQSGMLFLGNSDSSYVSAVGLGGLQTLWMHWYQTVFNNWAGVTFMRLYNAAGVNIFNVLNGDNGHQCQYWNGTALVNVGPAVPPDTTQYRFDLRIVIDGADSIIELYRNGILMNGTTFDGSNADVAAGVDQFRIRACGSFAGSQGSCSEIILADVTTINFRYATTMPTAAGSHSDWGGSATVANVAKAAINDSTFITSPTAGDKATYTGAVRAAVQAAQTIKFVKIIPRGRKDSSGPQQLDGMFTIGGTDYFGPDAPMSFGFSGQSLIFANDPSTSAPWAPAVAGSALEFGVRSAA